MLMPSTNSAAVVGFAFKAGIQYVNKLWYSGFKALSDRIDAIACTHAAGIATVHARPIGIGVASAVQLALASMAADTRFCCYAM
jgi:hypothetical protein